MNSRLQFIDIAKAFGIILVVIGHIPYKPLILEVWLQSFHMPLFFFLSGIVYKKENFTSLKKLVLAKTRGLLLPYFVLSIVMLLFKTIQMNGGGLIVNSLAILIQLRRTRFGIGLWFLPCLFVSFLFLYCINKFSRNKKHFLIFITISLVIGLLYAKFIQYPIIWGIDASFIAVFFLGLGQLIKERINFICAKKNLIIVPVLIINVLFSYLNYIQNEYSVGMWSSQYGNPLFFICASLSGILFVLCFSSYIKCTFLSVLGQRTLYYYGLHTIVIQVIQFLMSKFFVQQEHFLYEYSLFSTILVTIVVFVSLTPFYRLYEFVLRKCNCLFDFFSKNRGVENGK